MNHDAPIVDIALSVLVLVIAVGYVYASYVVGRFWRDQRGQSLGRGLVLSLVFTPLVGWIIGRGLEPSRAAPVTTIDPKSLHDELQETYQEVDKKLHAHP